MRTRATFRIFSCFLLPTAGALCAGCGGSDPPPFRLDMVNVVSNQIVPPHQQAVADTLEALFGTPDEPYALPATGLDQKLLQMAAGPVWSDEGGTKHGLYRRHCAHCHGISGDGRGPTALILNPYPRDYRLGVFKFKSTERAAPPTDDDIRRILDNGIPGTAMPSFALLPPDEVRALVEYVKYLSMRGQMERELIRYVADNLDFEPSTGEGEAFDPATNPSLRQAIMEDMLGRIVANWQGANEQVIIPAEAAIPPEGRTDEERVASISKGRELFFSATKGNCFSCHGPTGLGDGQQTDFDDWTKPLNDFVGGLDALPGEIETARKQLDEAIAKEDDVSRELYERQLQEKMLDLAARAAVVEGLLDRRNAIPRNLRAGIYRGGRRPFDIFARVYAGIPGTPMPGTGPASPGAQGALTQEEMWQLVDYVLSLPFEPASRPTVHPGAVNVGAVSR
jgi:mono/diheme cytochrome c family protein